MNKVQFSLSLPVQDVRHFVRVLLSGSVIFVLLMQLYPSVLDKMVSLAFKAWLGSFYSRISTSGSLPLRPMSLQLRESQRERSRDGHCSHLSLASPFSSTRLFHLPPPLTHCTGKDFRFVHEPWPACKSSEQQFFSLHYRFLVPCKCCFH